MGLLGIAGNVAKGAIAAAGTKDDGSTENPSNATGGGLKKIIDKLMRKSTAGAGDLADVKADPASAKKGGMVKKTGKATIHKNERILTVKQAKRYNKNIRKSQPRKSA